MFVLIQVSGGLALSEPSCSGFPSGSSEEDKSCATTESGIVKLRERPNFHGMRAIIYDSR